MLINDMLHDTTFKLLPTIRVVTWTSNMCMLLLDVTLHYDQPYEMILLKKYTYVLKPWKHHSIAEDFVPLNGKNENEKCNQGHPPMLAFVAIINPSIQITQRPQKPSYIRKLIHT